jgi:hypothetical protein
MPIAGWAVSALLAGLLLTACSVVVLMLILAEVNAKLPIDQKIPVSRLLLWEVITLHREMYSRDQKRVIMFGTSIAGGGFLIVAGLLLAPAILGWQ